MRRSTWSRAGVTVSEVSSVDLVFGMAPRASSPCESRCHRAPVVVRVRLLASGAPDPVSAVQVSEDPIGDRHLRDHIQVRGIRSQASGDIPMTFAPGHRVSPDSSALVGRRSALPGVTIFRTSSSMFRAVRTRSECCVHDAHQVVVALVCDDTVRLEFQVRADELEVGILSCEAGEDGVVGAGCIGLPVLQGGQAMVPVGDRDDRGGGCDALDGGEGGGVASQVEGSCGTGGTTLAGGNTWAPSGRWNWE
ncbi:hypothetical protein R1CP_07920 [Rhodococcus opacus]|uniref:Uncharacterized protein n=1 Tax=Rhodococcus opacus TaxID=37919 RepID=A0A1B1K115_RHOOP|nr:hypothetical protein R1CP_07920 [Rhodococcus opacus]